MLLAILMAALALGPRGAQAQTGGGSAEPDRAALIALYHATDGPNWIDSTNWLSDAPLGEWYGVTTDQDGRVTDLTLPTNGLAGRLPIALGTLTELTVLGLERNRLSGEIPRELGSLGHLDRLDLWDNQLTGEIPRELGSLSELTLLCLGYNQLTGEIPREFCSLANL